MLLKEVCIEQFYIIVPLLKLIEGLDNAHGMLEYLKEDMITSQTRPPELLGTLDTLALVHVANHHKQLRQSVAVLVVEVSLEVVPKMVEQTPKAIIALVKLHAGALYDIGNVPLRKPKLQMVVRRVCPAGSPSRTPQTASSSLPSAAHPARVTVKRQ